MPEHALSSFYPDLVLSLPCVLEIRYFPVFPAGLTQADSASAGWLPASDRKGFILQVRPQ